VPRRSSGPGERAAFETVVDRWHCVINHAGRGRTADLLHGSPQVPGPYNALSEGYGYVTAPPECLSDLSVECGATTCTWNTTSTCSRPTPPGPWTPADAPETATYTSVTSGTLPCNEVGTPQPVWVWTWPPVLNTLTPQPTLKPSLAPPTPACEDFTDAPFPTNKGGSVIKDCEWLQRRPANKKTQSCNRMTKWGGWCPATCGTC